MLGVNSEEQCRKILEKKNYETLRKLGKGSYGHVVLASKLKNQYAIKCISLKKCMKDPYLKRYISQETNTMCSLNHPNIVRLEDSFSDFGYHFIVMEYCDLGNLLNYQSKLQRRVLSFTESTKILYQIMKGVEAIHERNIIHRDLKCENIFLHRNKNGYYTCKIGDFGFAKVVSDTTKTSCGTIYFMAPEVIQHQPYDHQADIWSIGVIYFYTLFGQYPFKSLNIQKEIQSKCQHGYNLLEYCSLQKKKKQNLYLKDFFSKIFTINPKERITLQEMFAHQLFQNNQTEATSDASDDQLQQDVQWELERIAFIDRVYEDIAKASILDESILYAFKFYLQKVSRTFLNQEFMLQFLKQQPQNKFALIITKKNKEISSQIVFLIKLLKDHKEKVDKIEKFSEGFNDKIQDFNSFKQGYRNTVGKVYQETQKHIFESWKKSSLKFRVLCCHLINRVFSIARKDNFPFYSEWLKKQDKSTQKSIDFKLFEEWIKKQTPQKLISSVDSIHKIFYKKE